MNERWFCRINGKLHINLPPKKANKFLMKGNLHRIL